MRRFLNKRTLLIATALLLLISVATIAGVLFYLNSSAFNERVRKSIVGGIEAKTGGTVSLAKVRWDLRLGRLVLEDLTIRGTEPQTEPPLAHVESITAGMNLRSLLDKRLDLFELNVLHPQVRLLVNADGRTNLPGPPKEPDSTDSTFAISIKSLKVIEGSALVNNRYTSINFNLGNVASDSSYSGDTQTLRVKLAYGGTLTQDRHAAIPYVLSTEFDFTRGTIVAHRIEVTSGKSSARLQGRIDHALTAGTLGKLEYTGEVDAGFLNQFFPNDKLGGRAKAMGSLEFKPGSFSTQGNLSIARADFNEWNATAVRTTYSYSYPEKQLLLKQSTAKAMGGTASGAITVAPIPGEPRVTLEMQYTDIDAAQLDRVYPWDRKYVIYSHAKGALRGWFEGRERYEVEGESELTSYAPPAIPGVIAFPASGTVAFAARPADIEVKSSDVRFFDTMIQANGRVRDTEAELNVRLKSLNLANLHFLYKDANGEGSFEGTLKGPIRNPQLHGNVVLDRYKYKEWTVQHAEGVADLDVQTERATLAGVKATMGQSTLTIDGTTNLDGSNLNLRVRADRIRAEDFASIVNEKVQGTLSADVLVTSLTPLKVRGRVKASGLSARGRTFEALDGDLTLVDPSIEIENLTASERGARLTEGKVRYNRTTEEIDFQGNVSSLNLNRIRDLGVPETIEGNVQRARVTVAGTLGKPRIGGEATIENLTFRGEVFPRVRLQLSTEWPTLTAVLNEAANLDLTARIDLSDSTYPVKATAKFQNYSLEKIAQFNHGTLVASGDANLSGALRGTRAFSATGVIRSIHVRIQNDYPFDGSKPFGFTLDANQLKLTDEATLNGPHGTSMNISGAVGLTNTPKLELEARGNLDLRVFAELFPSWSVTGIVSFDGRIGGTSVKPSIDGKASFSKASLGYEGIYTTLTELTGDVRFSENRATFDNLEGRVGGGTIHVRGTGLLQNKQLEGLNVRIEAEQVRFRYPAGLRSTVTGALLVKGTSNDPILDGDLTVDSMTYRSDFEPFLAIFRPGGLDSGGTALDRLRLSIHIAGNRNVIIQNELTDISGARIDLDIKGTLGSPSLTGHVEVNDGTLLFQGKRYDITRGNIDFVDPLRIDPVVNVQAESDLRDYRVILRISGRGDDVHVDLTSDPPLPQLELVSLIAGGKTRQELQESGATSIPTSEELFQGGAASVLVDLLRSRLGNRFGLLGLDRVRIDPYLVGAGNKSAQITLSVTRDLSVTYSQDLSSNQQRVIQVEYFLSKNLSLVASREENNETTALGLDIRLRKRF